MVYTEAGHAFSRCVITLWRREVESVICVSDRPKSGSVGRTFPTQKIAALRAAVGRSVGRFRLKKNRRAARGGGSVGRTFPTHFFPRCARHGVGRSDWLRFSPRCERYRVGIERPSAQSVLRGPGERRARNRPRVRTTLIGSGLDHRTRFMTPCGAPTAV